mmetsp:Transcript_13743/g.25088  ORF Transcript_13743/g.25088 Transcript_13743/m.25088 type:complete len:202 (-) Transcript_13743:1245-1850(-)
MHEGPGLWRVCSFGGLAADVCRRTVRVCGCCCRGWSRASANRTSVDPLSVCVCGCAGACPGVLLVCCGPCLFHGACLRARVCDRFSGFNCISCDSYRVFVCCVLRARVGLSRLFGIEAPSALGSSLASRTALPAVFAAVVRGCWGLCAVNTSVLIRGLLDSPHPQSDAMCTRVRLPHVRRVRVVPACASVGAPAPGPLLLL